MYIKEILNRFRRDFTCIYICDICEHEVEGTGYDDANFHNRVVPSMKCVMCGKRARLIDYTPMATKYHENDIV